MSEHPRADIEEEANRLLAAAHDRGLHLRLIGGLAVRLHAEKGLPPRLQRDPKDLDFVTLKGKSVAAEELMKSMGYSPNAEFNQLNGHRRLLFYDPPNGRQVDIFVGVFEMAHIVPITDRIEVERATIPLAELLLTKLQVMHLNEKDQRDIIAILYDHPVGNSDENAINAGFVAKVLAVDWGFWRTTKLNLERTMEALPGYGLEPEQQELVNRRLADLWNRIEAEPKSTRWKLRSRIGDRVRWYEDPEEVG
ncbi:MAG: hypothetical protein M3082_02940 [Candidatus Dormibacteraeota bacterium]|nr:hypothetical protein [Candidatus Dormibacteraeota bacterium]